MIINIQSGGISPQYHVVFDDHFYTEASASSDESSLEFWNEIDIATFIYYVALEYNSSVQLQHDWLTQDELEESAQATLRLSKIRYSISSLPSSSSVDSSISSPYTLLVQIVTYIPYPGKKHH